MIDGTNKIAEHFAELTNGCLSFKAPTDAVNGWLPDGYKLVEDPEHVLKQNDCIMPALDTNWRLLSTVNGGERIGRLAKNVGDYIRYVATKI